MIPAILWLAVAALAAVETYVQYSTRGLRHFGPYLFAAVFIAAAIMFVRARKIRKKNFGF